MTFTKILYRVILPVIAIIGVVAFIFFKPTLDEGQEGKILTCLWLVLGFASVVLVLSLLDHLLGKIISWKAYPALRFFLQMILGTALSLMCLNYAYRYIKQGFTFAGPDPGQLIVMNMYGAAIILPLFSMYFGFQFLKDWRKSELETERLQKENARSQMMSLKNHLDPHFLFNNLNILSSLMDKDTGLSKEYLNKFAQVYRVILKAEQSDLVTLEEEMEMINAYTYLLKIRFGEGLNFDINIQKEHNMMALPPLTIQMLLENAIKHNMASKDNPLTVKIYSEEENQLIVENKIQRKKYAEQDHKGSGLDNIKNRYQFFSDQLVTIEESEELFRVRIPLLEIDYA